MKYLLCVLLVIPLIAKSQMREAIGEKTSERGIQWTNGLAWGQIQAKAKSENRYIFVDCFATWCVPCKIMDKEVYSNEQVGNAMNSRFISVRVQMDKTDTDDLQTTNLYPLAAQLKEWFHIEGYPTFLFFNPNGKLVLKELGFHDATGFVDIVKDALTDPEARYKTTIEKFKSGKLDYSAMPDLAREARARKEQQNALDIAKDYKENFLDKLSDEEFHRREYLLFIVDFSWDLIKSNDRYFKFFRNQTAIADSIMNRKISSDVVNNIIRKEEIIEKIYKDGKPISTQEPDWIVLQNRIKRKYGDVYIKRYFPEEQITFSALTHNWRKYIQYIDQKIE